MIQIEESIRFQLDRRQNRFKRKNHATNPLSKAVAQVTQRGVSNRATQTTANR